MSGLQAGIATEQTAAAAVTGIMTAEEAMIATMTGKEIENHDLVVMIRGATAGHVHVHQGEVLGIMIDMGMFASSLLQVAYKNGTPQLLFFKWPLLLASVITHTLLVFKQYQIFKMNITTQWFTYQYFMKDNQINILIARLCTAISCGKRNLYDCFW